MATVCLKSVPTFWLGFSGLVSRAHYQCKADNG